MTAFQRQNFGAIVNAVTSGDLCINAAEHSPGGHNIITPAVADALGVLPVGEGASGDAGAGELAQQYVRVDRVDIGDATLSDQDFFVIPLHYGTIERGARAPLAGLLGLEMFERFAMRFGYPRKTLTLRKLGMRPRCADHVR